MAKPKARLTMQKACRMAKEIVKSVYRGYFEHTPIQLTASHLSSRTYRRRLIMTIEVKEMFISMDPVRVDVWVAKNAYNGEIIYHSSHYSYFEPAFMCSARLISGNWSPIQTGTDQYEKVDIPTQKASQAARRFLRGLTGRKDWYTRVIRQKVGRYPTFNAYTKGNEANEAPKVKLIVKEGLEVVIVGFSPTAYPEIVRGIRGEIVRNERKSKRNIRRAAATMKAKFHVSRVLKIDIKRIKGESADYLDGGKSMMVNVYVDNSDHPLKVKVEKSGDAISAKIENGGL